MAAADPFRTTTQTSEPSDDEMAAILAAAEVLWPRPGGGEAPAPTPRWRFSGRWWSKPVPLRRERP